MTTTLYTAPNECTYIIDDVPDMPLLHSLGVYKGAVVTKKLSYNLSGPVLLLINEREVAIGRAISNQISVVNTQTEGAITNE